jgi:hypothetical protein
MISTSRLASRDGCISAARKREEIENRHIPLNFNEQNFDPPQAFIDRTLLFE